MSKTIHGWIPDESQERSVVLRRAEGGYELLYWDAVDTPRPAANQTAAGFSAEQVAFYRITVPNVKADQMDSLVRLQAETLVPLPPEQMALAWRSRSGAEGKAEVILAAARRTVLDRFCRQLEPERPDRVVLVSEAIAQAWKRIWQGNPQPTLVVYAGRGRTYLCVVEDGLLLGATTSDVGGGDWEADDPQAGSALLRLIQDIRRACDLFVFDPEGPKTIAVLCAQEESFLPLRERLEQSGFQVALHPLPTEKIRPAGELDPQQLYRYIPAIGTALLCLYNEPTFDLFRSWLPAQAQQVKRRRMLPLKITAPLAAVMLIGFLIIYGSLATARLHHRQATLELTDPNLNVSERLKAETLKKHVARQRIDILELLHTVSECEPNDVLVDRISFQRGQIVRIMANTKNQDRIFEFREALQNRPDIRTVRIQDPEFVEKDKVFRFTLTFDYKDWTTR